MSTITTDGTDLFGAATKVSAFELTVCRALDYLVATLAMPAVLLVAVAIQVANWLTGDFGPLLYRDARLGLYGHEFRMYKFRSMTVGSGGGPAVKHGDARVTTVGRFIRRTRLDELPQFINVLCGDMAVVGPRAMAKAAAAEIGNDLVLRYWLRFTVRPGITGLAHTIRAPRGVIATPADFVSHMTDCLEVDLEYLAQRGLKLYLKIIAFTPLTMLHGSGVA